MHVVFEVVTRWLLHNWFKSGSTCLQCGCATNSATIIALPSESYNGHLKYLFHSRAKIVDQLVFNVDVQQTLQLLNLYLLKSESAELLDFLSRKTQNRTMHKIGEHTYILGETMRKHISVEES